MPLSENKRVKRKHHNKAQNLDQNEQTEKSSSQRLHAWQPTIQSPLHRKRRVSVSVTMKSGVVVQVEQLKGTRTQVVPIKEMELSRLETNNLMITLFGQIDSERKQCQSKTRSWAMSLYFLLVRIAQITSGDAKTNLSKRCEAKLMIPHFTFVTPSFWTLSESIFG